jgi:D-lactate dehydrogenase
VKPGLQGSAASAQLATPSARATQSGIPRQVVFLPTCVNRMMGAARGDDDYKGSTLDVFTRLANKAGYQVIVPKVRSRALLGGGIQGLAA